MQVHPRVSLVLLQSTSCPRRPCFPCGTWGAFLGVSFLIAASVQRVHSRWASRPTSVPSAAFRTLSTAYSSLYLADLFHPAATSRIPLRGSSPDPAAPPRRWPCPLAVGAASLSPVARRRQATSRRPQDLVPGRDPQRRSSV